MNLFDTADVYSEGRSEEVLGKALGRQARQGSDLDQGYVSGSGMGPTIAAPRAITCDGALEGSLRRLGTDYVDIYHLHGFDALTPVEEVQDTLNNFVREGKVRYIACSNFSGWHLMKSLAVGGSLWVDALRRAPGVLLADWPRLRVGTDAAGIDQKVGALVWSPLGWGRLTGKIRRGQPLPDESRLHKTAERAAGFG